MQQEASEIARGILEQLGVVGVLCVEFFLTRAGKLLVNELAPRPHNSGHLTIDASVTSQFEQQLRAACGLPLGSTAVYCAAAMANLLGDVWQGGEPNWAAALALPGVKLHLYGKAEARPGRKMGHLTALARHARGSGAAGAAGARVVIRASKTKLTDCREGQAPCSAGRRFGAGLPFAEETGRYVYSDDQRFPHGVPRHRRATTTAHSPINPAGIATGSGTAGASSSATTV